MVAANVQGFMLLGYLLPSTHNRCKFIIKSSLVIQMFKAVCPAETTDRLCF